MLFNTEPAFITLTFIIKTKLCFRYKGIIYDPNYIDKYTLCIYILVTYYRACTGI